MHCKNCNHPLSENQNYCDNCGAKVIRNRLEPKVLIHQVNEQFLSIDNKLLRTFVALCVKPEDVIGGYINGTRRKYIDVLQYFAVSLTLAGFQAFLMLTFFKEQLELSNEMMNTLQNAPGNENNPFSSFSLADYMQYQGFVYIATLPISVLSTWLTYYIIGDRRLNFTEHIVLNIYYSSQVIIVTAILSIVFMLFNLNFFIVSLVITLPTFIYLGFVLKRVFNDGFWDAFAKWMLIVVIYGIFYFVVMIIITLIPFLMRLQ
ncbi:DUF3667 domain-containing protein [Winogradskyella tangerina]|uniref:DUF3667 domain-containing protein n=1 Tax=Winogradskyella tangerina TaxID=2023240 RepID=UPI000DBE1306|nr:DUF3667 domain-containing protein [Winogradskyella tangerina]